MIPKTDTVKIYMGEALDDWGIMKPAIEATEYKAMVTYSTKLEELKTVDGKTTVVTATVILQGKVELSTGSMLELEEGKKLPIVQITPVKDLGGKQLFTKVVV